MPTPERILDGLHEIANDWRILSVLWHLYFGILAAGLLRGARPRKRTAGILLSLPLLSVSILAWQSCNPFNGAVFALGSFALVLLSLRMKPASVLMGPRWLKLAGSLMFLFGWVYPHFLDTPSFLSYLYTAPTGLIPCPTLSIVIGLALVLNGLDSRTWPLVLGVMGLFYGVFGVLRLGVPLDAGLIAGAVPLLVLPLKRDQRSGPGQST